ncbi:MAG: CapA family protein [Bacteroidetes bacterium]|nr:CapA family protein [Bacteroidota bacterium]
MKDCKIVLLGDVALNGIISNEPEKNILRYAKPKAQLKDATAVFANLEVPVKVAEVFNANNKILLHSLEGPTREVLQYLNVSCVSIANNHIYDCKMEGVKATIGMLEEIGIKFTGAGWKKQHIEPVILNIGQSKIGFMAYVDKSTNPKTENYPELLINYFDPIKVKEDLFLLKPQVDKVICSIHWGVDYSYYPTPKQVEIARDLINCGIDVIMGHHPHTMQPFEIFKSGLIFYSLGGLTFGDSKLASGKYRALKIKTKKGLIAELTESLSLSNTIVSKELKGNYIEFTGDNYLRWSNKKWTLYNLIKKFKIAKILNALYQSYFERTYEYLFGYYRNPLKSVFSISEWKKLKYLKKDFIKYKA